MIFENLENKMKYSSTIKSISVAAGLMALAACQSTANSSAGGESSAVSMVVAKMAEGDVGGICKGGRETITAAATKATKTLATAGQISGDFNAIGKESGSAFYDSKCG
jgi:hypothetical protein